MKKILSGLCASTFALAFVLGTAPASAAPVYTPSGSQASTNVQSVQFNSDWRRNGNRAQHRQNHFENRGNRDYYNGYRGYSEKRRGYRQYNGVWFPAAAFITGAIIGGSVNNQPRAIASDHIAWCTDRYRSYRASDNSFQPSNGPRRQCVSS